MLFKVFNGINDEGIYLFYSFIRAFEEMKLISDQPNWLGDGRDPGYLTDFLRKFKELRAIETQIQDKFREMGIDFEKLVK